MYVTPTNIYIFYFYFYIHSYLFFFFFNDTATTEIYTLSLHDALPISFRTKNLAFSFALSPAKLTICVVLCQARHFFRSPLRSEEHTSELQSQSNLVCRLLLEKKNKNRILTFEITR